MNFLTVEDGQCLLFQVISFLSREKDYRIASNFEVID